MVDRLRLLLLLSVLFGSLPLWAHGLKLYVEAEAGQIRGQVHFASGAAARSAQIRISDAGGEELAVLAPDDEGRFSYPVDSPRDLVVVADSLDGHRASRSLKAEELRAFLPAEEESGAEPPCAQVVAEKSASLREALTACEERQRLRDILGGLGYIVGLAGLGLWWGGRRKRGQ